MNKCALVSVTAGLLVLSLATGVFALDLVWEDISRGNSDLKTVLIHPDNPNIIYAGSGNAIIKTADGGESWRNILSVTGENKAVNFLLFYPKDKNFLYAATGNGLFYSANQGSSWRRIFRGKNYLEDNCMALVLLPYGIYLGTKGGLFVSNDNGRSWHKEPGILGNSPIFAITCNLSDPSRVYIACLNGVFKTENSGKAWEKIFTAYSAENGDNVDEINQDRDEPERFSEIRYIGIGPNNQDCLYVAASKGVYKSQDKGKTWGLLTDYGLLSREVKFLLVSSNSTIYAVTKSGVFEYKYGRWHELSLGLTAEDIRFLAQDNLGSLYVACDNSLFKANIKKTMNDKQNNIMSFYGKDEPGISEVQEAAVNYAEVHPDKIRQWRKQAAKKAWLPQVSMGLDRNVADLWHWESGSTTKADDDALRRGRDSVEWDVNLSWDLSELIYSDDQTSIDVRSRLMVQLRDDVLDEVTKLYFERIRVKMELDNLSIEDRKKRFEKELRLQELTAYLDGLTGGYFLKQIK